VCLEFIVVGLVAGESWDKSKEAGREQASERGCSTSPSRLSSHHVPRSDWPRAWELDSLDSLDKAPQTSVPGIRSEPKIHQQILPAVEDGQIHPG
jgi:hypothetical protein